MCCMANGFVWKVIITTKFQANVICCHHHVVVLKNRWKNYNFFKYTFEEHLGGQYLLFEATHGQRFRGIWGLNLNPDPQIPQPDVMRPRQSLCMIYLWIINKPRPIISHPFFSWLPLSLSLGVEPLWRWIEGIPNLDDVWFGCSFFKEL